MSVYQRLCESLQAAIKSREPTSLTFKRLKIGIQIVVCPSSGLLCPDVSSCKWGLHEKKLADRTGHDEMIGTQQGRAAETLDFHQWCLLTRCLACKFDVHVTQVERDSSNRISGGLPTDASPPSDNHTATDPAGKSDGRWDFHVHQLACSPACLSWIIRDLDLLMGTLRDCHVELGLYPVKVTRQSVM